MEQKKNSSSELMAGIRERKRDAVKCRRRGTRGTFYRNKMRRIMYIKFKAAISRRPFHRI